MVAVDETPLFLYKGEILHIVEESDIFKSVFIWLGNTLAVPENVFEIFKQFGVQRMEKLNITTPTN